MAILIELNPLPGRYCEVRPRSFHAATRDLFAQVPGGAHQRWDKERGCYVVPAEVAQVVVDKLVVAGVAKKRGRIVEEFESIVLPSSATNRMRDYQVDGIRFIVETCEETGAALLADDLGLGKSNQAYRAARALDAAGNVLIVCPAVMTSRWAEEVQNFGGEGSTQLSSKSASWRGVGISSWDTFRSLTERGVQLSPASIAILDELHYASNSRAQRTQAVRKYTDSLPDIFKIGLTATPIPTRVRDLHSQLDLLWPGRWGSFFQFTRRYCDGQYVAIEKTEKSFWKSDGSSNLDELHVRLNGLMLRRTKADVKMQLPARNRMVVPVRLPDRALDGMRMHAQWAIDGRGMRRALSHVEDHKIAAAIALAKESIAAGGKVLVYTLTRKAAEQIAYALKTVHVHGDVIANKRKAVLLRGCADHSCAVATVFSVTEGISLTEFDTIIYVGIDWMPKTTVQSEGRVHRWGATKQVNVYFLIALNTIDEVIRSTVIERLDNFTKVIGTGDEASLAEELDDSSDDLLKQIVEQVREQVKRERRRR